MHHSDREMDVTTATRFHVGEHLFSAALRLALIPLFGFEIVHLLIYETLVLGVTMFHHANISLGRWDALLRWLIVTPFMHKVHHSRWRPETNSNYATLFSSWDRLFRSFRMRADCSTIELGLDEFVDAHWQTFGGMLKTPFAAPAAIDQRLCSQGDSSSAIAHG
jgi:sterol desaturase/sphingolipid hydroxylase (fatty acid hydroxylase superfamily)